MKMCACVTFRLRENTYILLIYCNRLPNRYQLHHVAVIKLKQYRKHNSVLDDINDRIEANGV